MTNNSTPTNEPTIVPKKRKPSAKKIQAAVEFLEEQAALKKKRFEAKRKAVQKRTRLKRKANFLTLEEAVAANIELKGLDELLKSGENILDFYTEEQLQKAYMPEKKNYLTMRGKGKQAYSFIPLFNKWVTVTAYRKFNKENLLVSRTVRAKLDNLKGVKKRKKKSTRIMAQQSTKPGYTRNANDHYPTPGDTTKALLDFMGLPKDTIIYEPACGRGHISKTYSYEGYRVISSDLIDYNFGEPGIDFLSSRFVDYDWLITNPPFSLAEEFIRKAYKNGKPFAMLVKAVYWHTKGRRDLFMQTRPTHVLPLTWRQDFSLDKKENRSTMDCMWVIWGPESFNNLGKPFTTDYFPLARPTNYPVFNKQGELIQPYKPFED